MIDEAKPIATSTVETISSAEPAVVLATGGALVIAYLLLPPIFSAISFSLRGYQGKLFSYYEIIRVVVDALLLLEYGRACKEISRHVHFLWYCFFSGPSRLT